MGGPDHKSVPDAENGTHSLQTSHFQLESKSNSKVNVNLIVNVKRRGEGLFWKVFLLSFSLSLMVPGVHTSKSTSTTSVFLRHLKLERIGKMIKTLEHVEQKMDEMELSVAMIDTKDPTYDGLLNKTPKKDGLTDSSDMPETFKEAQQWLICDVWSKYEEIWRVYESISRIFGCLDLEEISDTYNQLVLISDKLLQDLDQYQDLEFNLKQQLHHDKDAGEDDFFDLVQRSSGAKMKASLKKLLQADRQFYNSFDPKDLTSLELLSDEIMDKIKEVQEIAKDYY